MGGEVVEKRSRAVTRGPRRSKRRIAVRIDMTPMVDIAFLLLIFYMVSTVFSMPQAMEINLPKGEEAKKPVVIRESDLLTLRVDSESRYWWHLRRVRGDNLPRLIPSADPGPGAAYAFNSDSLRSLLFTQNRANPNLSTLLLIHRDATHADLVNIMDEIDGLERAWNAYLADSLGKDVDDLTTEDGRFSYRYAIDEWEPNDDRVMADAVAAARDAGEL